METLENIIYEAKPYFLFGLAIYALSSADPKPWIVGCALILLFCGSLVIRMRFKNRKDSSLERLFYEIQPFFYLGFGIFALIYLRGNKFAAGCALLLLFCASMILRWRFKHRS